MLELWGSEMVEGDGVFTSSGMVAGGPGVLPASCVCRASSLNRARLFSEWFRTMLSFSACMPRMWGICGIVGGGVGGMSPVMRTRASTPAVSSFKAARGETLKMSSGWALSSGEVMGCKFGAGHWTTSRGSVEGFGGGGGDWGAELSLALVDCCEVVVTCTTPSFLGLEDIPSSSPVSVVDSLLSQTAPDGPNIRTSPSWCIVCRSRVLVVRLPSWELVVRMKD